MKSGVKEKVLEFECNDNHSVKNASYVGIEIDEDYIYCQDFLIPRKGGTITRLPPLDEKKCWVSSYSTIFGYNKKNIFYLDSERKIHRIDKKTRGDVVISDPDKIYPMDIRCTEDGLYVQRYRVNLSIDYIFDEADDYDYDERDTELGDSCDLYHMDVNGENMKRIWKGKDLD